MYKFIITLQLTPGARDEILAAAPAVQAATRDEAGCIGYDFFTCTDDPDKLVFVETWVDQTAHAHHLEQPHTRRFIAFHERFHSSFAFEPILTDS